MNREKLAYKLAALLEPQPLYEFFCKNKHCREFFLSKDIGIPFCPYCGENDTDYVPGPNEPVVIYKPTNQI